MAKTFKILLLIVPFTLLLSACDRPTSPATQGDASSFTIEKNQQVYDEIDIADQQDFKDAQRGLIARAPDAPIKNPAGRTVWHPGAYSFLEGESPDTVNPSLWRQAKLNNIRGLFKVKDGIYQLRGFDLANMTLIDSDSGWIVVDPLTTVETANSALNFARKHLGNKIVKAVIFTHSHVDHFGGALGLLSKEELATRKANNDPLTVIAPSGFVEESVSELIVAGPAMTRRGVYMYGQVLERSAKGHIDSGLGKQPVFGTVSTLQPTIDIESGREILTIDGVEIVFLNMPGSEAPAELTFYLPTHQAYCGAEVTSRTLHNLYTLRGAKVRDGLRWSTYINNSIAELDGVDTYFGSHHWPIWGNSNIVTFMEKQRDLYRFIHDQTLQLANKGFTPREIAEKIKLPSSLSSVFYNRDYYGTVKHNSKAVYQHYFGWYDANPANLDPLPPTEAATRYVEYMGGAEAILGKAQVSYDKGEYRWVAEVLNHLVFADPSNKEAKNLLAASYQQMAYQAESAPWRDVYLTAGLELQEGTKASTLNKEETIDLLYNVPTHEFFKSMATQLKADDAEGVDESIKIVFTDTQETYVLSVKNSVLHYTTIDVDKAEISATLTLTLREFLDFQVGIISLKDLLTSDNLSVDGSTLKLLSFLSMLDSGFESFNIVTP